MGNIFLKQYCKKLVELFSSKASKIYPAEIKSNEKITRYIISKKNFAASTLLVKHTAIMPMFNSDTDRFETSVYRTNELTENNIWEIATRHVESEKRKAKAIACGLAKQYVEWGLKVVSVPTPHPAHADIVAWPSEKDHQMQIAKEITKDLHLTIRHP